MFSEWIMRGAITLFFVLTVLSLSIYNPGMRTYLQKYIKTKSKVNYCFTSLFPFAIAFIISAIHPKILDIFWFIGLVLCNFNGFIIPTLMYYKLLVKQNKSILHRVAVLLLLAFFILSGIIGVFQKIFGF